MDAARGAKDDEALMQQFINNNPQYLQAYNEMKQQGGSLKEVFMNRARSMGLSEDEISNMLNGIHR